MMKDSGNILIAGAGQVGSRHLQGLISCSLPLNVYVYDNKLDSLRDAKSRWNEILGEKKVQHKIFYLSNLEKVPPEIDVAIISTPADVRLKIILEINNLIKVRYWILEKVLAQSIQELNQIKLSIGDHTRAWVNTPRCAMLWHQKIKQQIKKISPLFLEVKGGDWGMACNSIHFLSMLGYWTNEHLIEINTDQLEHVWSDAKRKGYMEVKGILRGKFSAGTEIVLSAGIGPAEYIFYLHDGDHLWKIDEFSGVAERSDGLVIEGKIPFQSEMTGILVEELLAESTCQLTPLQESIDMHSVLLTALLEHWKKYSDSSANKVPIT